MQRLSLRADDGFTLVELLVAVLIIGILAAIGLAAFLDQRLKAQDAEAKTSAVTAAKAMVAYSTDQDGSYADATPADLTKIEPALGQARGLAVDATAFTFTVSVDSAAGDGAAFSIERTTDGASLRDCTKPGLGACRATADANGNRW
jgi:prepilin-type N-terminal cleavage/methylation domain-containing protein